MNKAKIEIHSQGYDDYSVVLDKLPSAVTKTEILQAKVAWCKLNDVDEDTIELPFHRITKIKRQPLSVG